MEARAEGGAGAIKSAWVEVILSVCGRLADLFGLSGPLLLAAKKKSRKKSGKDGGQANNGKRSAKKAAPADEEEQEPEEEEPEEPDPDDLESLEDDDETDLDDEDDENARRVRPRPASEWSSGSSQDDMDLIQQFLAGDEEAFTRLVIKYQNKIHNLCFRVIGDRDEAQDMAQEVFMTVHKSLRNFRGDSLFSTWIFRVTVNHCKNRIKYLGRRRYYQSTSIDKPQEMPDGEMFWELADDSPDPEDLMASEQVQAVVQEAISTLDADHRIVIVLRDIQNLSYEEIAEIVGIKVGTVKSRIHRARNDLKKRLEQRIKF